MLLEHKLHCGLGMDALVTVYSWSTNVTMVWNVIMVWAGILVTVCSWNRNVTMVWAWMLW